MSMSGAQPAAAGELPSFEAVRAANQPSDWLVTDRYGEPLQRVRRDSRVRRLGWLPLAEVSPALQAALVTAEDKRFWNHGGVDWAAFARAAWQQLAVAKNRHRRGASTLTMQLAGLLDPALRPADGRRRNLAQKWDQVWAARALEAHWSKAQILEAYLNLVPWRGEAIGLPAAARLWFGKDPDGLDLAEGALLAALLRQPQAPAARVGERACAIVAGLDAAALPTTPRPDCAAIEARASFAFAGPAPHTTVDAADLAPHAARRALAEWGARPAPPPGRPGGEPLLRTTLDARLQRLAIESLHSHLAELAQQNIEDGAAIVFDNESGEILAYVGSSGSLSAATEVDGITAPRQAGSTLKPFLYSLAIEQQRLTAASLLHDSPLQLTAENGAYIPQNYDHQFKGWVSARTALAASLNIPAVRTLLLAGTDAFQQRLKDLGFVTLTEPADHYGLALALGGADVRLIDLTNAYRTLANRGRWQAAAPLDEPTAHDTTRHTRQVIAPGAAFIVTDILADRAARAPTFGLENALATRVWSAAKTGTSKDMRDNWCVGFTRRHTVGVWVGNFSGAPMWDVSGVQGAAPVWRDLIHALASGERDKPPAPPAGVVASAVRFAGVTEAPRREWFLRGTETPLVTRADLATDDTTPVIAYPADGLIVAIDADIPADRERMVFEMQPARSGYSWRLERLTGPPCQQSLQAPARWAPQPGYWRLELRAADDKVAGSVRFSVRGSSRHAEECIRAD
jgi:penicillin-binding protein 1C